MGTLLPEISAAEVYLCWHDLLGIRYKFCVPHWPQYKYIGTMLDNCIISLLCAEHCC